MTTVSNDPAAPEHDSGADMGDNGQTYPETWRWDEHGDICSGTFVRFDKGATRDYGKKLIMILEVDGLARSVWLLQTALYERIRDELAERPDHRLAVGERVAIHRLAATTTQDGKRSYRPFRIYFPDRPELDVAAEFDLDSLTRSRVPESEAQPTTDRQSTTAASDALHGDIPF
jgi:hypothetical protein